MQIAGIKVTCVLVALSITTMGGAARPTPARAVLPSLAPSTVRVNLRATGQPHLLIWPMTVAPGAALTVAGIGYAAGEPVALTLAGLALSTTPAVVTADAQGNFIATATVPATIVSGPAPLVVAGTRSHISARTLVAVLRPSAATWYFAGLDTRVGTRSTIAVLNPDNNPARVTLHLALADGRAGERAVTLAGHSRSTLDLAALAGGRRALFFVRLSADRRVFAAATITGASGAWSSVPGVSAPRRTWYLAEGYVDSATHEDLRLYNPAPRTARVTVRLLPQQGPGRLLSVVLGGDQGREVAVNAHVPRGAVGAIIQASRPVVVQRFSAIGPHDAEATASTGVADRAALWTFPMGIAPQGARTFYAVLNPDRSNPAAATATFYDARRRVVGRATVVMAPLHRATIAAPASTRAATLVVLTSNIPVVAERTILVASPHSPVPPGGYGYTVGPASAQAGQVLPDGDTSSGHREYLVLQNGNNQAAQVGIEFYTTRGTAVHVDLALPAYARQVLLVNRVVGLPAGEHGAVVFSSGTPVYVEQQIVPVQATAPSDRLHGPSGCTILLPRAAFPTHMTQWVSTLTAPNAGAVASGLQQASYRWGYVVVTPDLYSTVVLAQQRFEQAARTLGGQQVHLAMIGQQMVVRVRGDQLTHYTITTILLRARTTVAAVNVGAGGPVVSVAADMARAVSARACG